MSMGMQPPMGLAPSRLKSAAISWFISWNLPSGLCTYWVMGNVVSIIQQLWMNNTSFGREMRAEAEKRARKKGQPAPKA